MWKLTALLLTAACSGEPSVLCQTQRASNNAYSSACAEEMLKFGRCNVKGRCPACDLLDRYNRATGVNERCPIQVVAPDGGTRWANP